MRIKHVVHAGQLQEGEGHVAHSVARTFQISSMIIEPSVSHRTFVMPGSLASSF